MQNLVQLAWPFILMAVIFYLLIYRPQKRDQKKRMELLESLKVGNRIVTIGGIYGEITKVMDDRVRIKVAEGVEIRIRKSAVGSVLTTTFEKANAKAEDKKEDKKADTKEEAAKEETKETAEDTKVEAKEEAPAEEAAKETEAQK
jgi:preprotein translocase subunit YajC